MKSRPKYLLKYFVIYACASLIIPSAQAALSMDCAKTRLFGVNTLECVMSWDVITQAVYDFGSMNGQASGPNGAPFRISGFETDDFPLEFSQWLVGWAPGQWSMFANGSLFFIFPGIGAVFLGPEFDDVIAPLP